MGNSKIRIFIVGRDKVGWSIDKDRKAVIYLLREYGFSLTKNIFMATHIFCVWFDLLLSFKYQWIAYFGKVFNKKIIAVITNDITYTPEKLESIKKLVDICIAPSKKIHNFLIGQNIKAHRIPFSVDMAIFRPLEMSKQEICKKLGIDYKRIENKIIIGSFQRDSLGKNLKEEKWQKNPNLLIQILERLPRKKYLLLLAGPRRHYIAMKCNKKNIPTLFYGDYSYLQEWKEDIVVNNLSLEVINLLYSLADIYIISSKSEGGPKQVLESSLTKTLVFSTKVGLAQDILHPDILFEENKIGGLIEKMRKYFEHPEKFNEYIEYNFQKARDEMDKKVLEEKYRKIIFDN